MNRLLLLAALMFAVSGCATTTKETTTAPEPTAQTTAPATTESATTQGITAVCPQTCRMMNCPPPYGTYKKCCPLAPYTQTCP